MVEFATEASLKMGVAVGAAFGGAHEIVKLDDEVVGTEAFAEVEQEDAFQFPADIEEVGQNDSEEVEQVFVLGVSTEDEAAAAG